MATILMAAYTNLRAIPRLSDRQKRSLIVGTKSSFWRAGNQESPTVKL